MRAPFSASYVAGDVRAKHFYPCDFRDPEARVRIAQSASARRVTPALMDALLSLDASLPPSESRRHNLDRLALGAAAVVTGQQVGLFGGPLYTIHKAATAIAAARALEAEAGVPVVPIFWLQTEDHDLAEIDHCHVAAPETGPLSLALASAPSGRDDRDDRDGRDRQHDQNSGRDARVSVGLRRLADDVRALHGTLEETLGALPHASAFLPLLFDCYAPGRSLTDAFARLIAVIFRDHGLILLDPRDARIAALRAPIVHKTIEAHEAIAAALVDRSRELDEAGFESQVHARPDALLAFAHLHPDGHFDPEAPRHRLGRCEGGWRIPDGGDAVLSTSQLLDALERTPLAFSTSALLRPLTQDAILPTAAYVGGPGEINYFAQLPPLYSALGMTPPLLLPRARVRLVDDRARSLLQKLGLQPSDTARPRDELLLSMASRSTEGEGFPPPAEIRAALLGRFERELGEVEARAEEIDPKLDRAVARTRATVARAVEKLVGKYARSLGERDRVRVDRLDRLLAILQPNGVPQERFYAVPSFACRHGVEHILARIFAAIDAAGPFSAPHLDVEL